MYCKKCGKQLDYDGDICKECQEAETYFGSTQEQPVETPVTTEPTTQPVSQEADKKFGFGTALASTIMGAIAYFIMAIASGIPLGVIEAIEEAGLYTAEISEIAMAGIAVTMVFWVIGVGLSIPALIMGIKSIKCFVARKKAGYVKPIPTLVLGLIGLIASATAILFALSALALVAALAMYL